MFFIGERRNADQPCHYQRTGAQPPRKHSANSRKHREDWASQPGTSTCCAGYASHQIAASNVHQLLKLHQRLFRSRALHRLARLFVLASGESLPGD
ncbi:hypothetical protein ALQ03_103233 [Pseudomonas savastanoi pv. glycinea]|uniref:Uncharacterized protein n=2 Tax=Pseudomonas syringae group genomosp. 2 TaxID=251698 RepID=A0A0P9TAB9_PSESG|nr:hypothetical protein ALO82_102893 [Pseudomonas syringae pv. broussonetiae]KPX37486.1 hypothetical protein ALO37_102982 [Pseudomonas savastanoi pv. glycinea]KPX54132.1 hypothetical protein ALO67_102297 [Pseudomonas amygdali pv. hibisci]RMQ57305.1 hypothetical protein ALQ02_102763 [Pseudomonas savastanoi pv. phaseolicola]RMM68870.1 hypothetical protein ALQ73_102601 [Pseudomonas savastanoi pv. glycinea]